MADHHFLTRARIADLTKVFRHRYGNTLPQDDGGSDDLEIVLDHIVKLPDGKARARNFVEIWAPWLSPERLERLYGAAVERNRFWSAADLGEQINLYLSDRRRWGITTIAAWDYSSAELAALRRAEKAQRERERRKAKGASHVPKTKPGAGRQAELAAVVRAAGGWLTNAELRDLLSDLPSWRDHRGQPLRNETFRRVLNREVDALVAVGVFEQEMLATKFHTPARRIRIANGATRGSVPALLGAGTKTVSCR